MLHFYLRLILLLFALLTAALLLIHARPYDDHELRQLLLPDGCPAPCFMGIRPGVTKISETIDIHNSRILKFQFIARDNPTFVDVIHLETSIPYGEIYLILGGGKSNEHYVTSGRKASGAMLALYPALDLIVFGSVSCPASAAKYWNAPVIINITVLDLRPPDFGYECLRAY